MTPDDIASDTRAELEPRLRLACGSMREDEFQKLIDGMMRDTIEAMGRDLLDGSRGRIAEEMRDLHRPRSQAD